MKRSIRVRKIQQNANSNSSASKLEKFNRIRASQGATISNAVIPLIKLGLIDAEGFEEERFEDKVFVWNYSEEYIQKPTLREGCKGDVHNNRLYVFGGFESSGGRTNNVAVFDISSGKWKEPNCIGNVPPPRFGHSATLVDDNLWIYGGEGSSHGVNSRNILGDVFVLRLPDCQWQRIMTSLEPPRPGRVTFMPSPRRGHTSNYYTRTNGRKSLFVFGGKGPDRVFGMDVFFNDIQRLDLEDLQWHELETKGEKPSGRTNHTATLIPLTPILCIFGGLSTRIYSTVKTPRLRKREELHISTSTESYKDSIFADNSIHLINLDTDTWYRPRITGEAPSPRYGHSMVAHSGLEGFLLLFGGKTRNGSDNQLYLLNIDEKRWSRLKDQNPPSPRHDQLLVSHSDKMLLFGGYRDEGLCDAQVYTLEIPSIQTSFHQKEWKALGESHKGNLLRNDGADRKFQIKAAKSKRQWVLSCRSSLVRLPEEISFETLRTKSNTTSRDLNRRFNLYSSDFRPPSRACSVPEQDQWALITAQHTRSSPEKDGSCVTSWRVKKPTAPKKTQSTPRPFTALAMQDRSCPKVAVSPRPASSVEHSSMFTGNRSAILRRKQKKD